MSTKKFKKSLQKLIHWKMKIRKFEIGKNYWRLFVDITNTKKIHEKMKIIWIKIK